MKDEAGRWVTAPRAQRATRWKARVYVRGHDGIRREVTRYAATRRAAELAASEAVAETLRTGGSALSPGMPLLAAGEHWLAQIERSDSRLSDRTKADYRWSWGKYVATSTSSLRGLTLSQANDPQRLRAFLQVLAEAHGSGSAKKTKSVLTGVLAYAVENGVLPSNAMRQVRTVRASAPRASERDHSRAMTRAERDHVVQVADAAAAEERLNPRTRRTREATADLVAFLAGTGVRIDEARRLRWSDLDLRSNRVHVLGTKSETADRWLNLPAWLGERLQARAGRVGIEGLVFASPAHVGDSERVWDQSNSAGAVRKALDAAGLPWAVSHTFRRTVATLLDEAGTPIAKIADQLGHADVSMTARVYLGRDLQGDKRDLAAVL